MLKGTYHKVVEIKNPDTQLKEQLKETRKALKKKIAVDVFDAFENSVVEFWLGKDATTEGEGADPEERQYLYFPKIKSLHAYDGGEINLSSFSFSFKLKQNFDIIAEHVFKQINQDFHDGEVTYFRAALEKFWKKGVDEIFCEHQFRFEEDLDRALEEPLEGYLNEVLKNVPTT